MISFGTHIDMIFNTIVTGNILLRRLFMMCDLETFETAYNGLIVP